MYTRKQGYVQVDGAERRRQAVCVIVFCGVLIGVGVLVKLSNDSPGSGACHDGPIDGHFKERSRRETKYQV